METLRELVLHTWFPSKDALIQQAFAAIQCVYSVSKTFRSRIDVEIYLSLPKVVVKMVIVDCFRVWMGDIVMVCYLYRFTVL